MPWLQQSMWSPRGHQKRFQGSFLREMNWLAQGILILLKLVVLAGREWTYLFLAMKLEAFAGRGRNDFLASHDLEDVITVVDGREEIAKEIQAADPRVKLYLRASVSRFLADPRFVESLPGHLAPDEGSQGRLRGLLERLRMIAGGAGG